jgi:hypothetical protein
MIRTPLTARIVKSLKEKKVLCVSWCMVLDKHQYENDGGFGSWEGHK